MNVEEVATYEAVNSRANRKNEKFPECYQDIHRTESVRNDNSRRLER